MGDQIVKKRGAIWKIAGPGVAVEQEVPLLQIGRQPPPGGGLPAQPGHVGGALHPGALPLRRQAGPSAGSGSWPGGVPPHSQKQDHAGHRQRQQQAHPHQLVGGASRPLVHPDGHHGAGQLQNKIDDSWPCPASRRVRNRVMAIWAITVRAHMERLVTAEIRRSVRSFGLGQSFFRTARSTSFPPQLRETAYLFYYTGTCQQLRNQNSVNKSAPAGPGGRLVGHLFWRSSSCLMSHSFWLRST